MFDLAIDSKLRGCDVVKIKIGSSSAAKRRGGLTLWIDETAVAGWQAERRATLGGQRHYSDLAISLVLTLRLVFRLALRQAEAFVASVLRLLGLDQSVALAPKDRVSQG